MAYTKVWPEGWKDNEEGGTYINAAGLNNMEQGIIDAHTFQERTDNPHKVTKAQVGLGNAENTADMNKNVNSAKTLTTPRTIDGVSFNGGANITHYGTCSTDAATTAKTVTCAGFTLEAGARITVKFTVTNTGAVGSLTLNVNGTGAKAIKYRGGNLPAAGTLAAGRVYTFMYDGTNYELIGDLDSNTTYTPATAVPLMDGIAAVGSSAKYAREDHRHPIDTSRASVADIEALQAENALLRELLNGVESPIYREATPGNPVEFSDGAAANVKALSVEITPTQSGSGNPAPDNIRPIIGVSSVKVTRTGKNLLPCTITSFSRNGVTVTVNDDGSLTFNGTVTQTFTFPYCDMNTTRPLFASLMGESVTFSVEFSGTQSGGKDVPFVAMQGPVTAGIGISITASAPSERTLTVVNSSGTCQFFLGVYEGAELSNFTIRPMLRLSSVDDNTFEPCSSQSVTVSTGSAGTVYGGTFNVTTRELTVTHRLLTVSDFLPAEPGISNGRMYYYDTATFGASDAPSDSPSVTAISNMAVNARSWAWDMRYVCFNVSNIRSRIYSDAETYEAFTQRYADLQIVYELATPLVYQLTPAQLATLDGYNCIVTDAGSLSVNYQTNYNHAEALVPASRTVNGLALSDNVTITLTDIAASSPVPEQHRMMFGGRSLGTGVTEEQIAAVRDGSFTGLLVGDYWVINGVTWRIVDMDYWYGCGDTAFTKHHLVIMPDSSLTTARMNETNTTTGGYTGSKLYTDTLPTVKATCQAAFPSMILSHREYLVNAVTDGRPSAGAWTDSDVELPGEIMMYGSHILSPANDGATVATLYTINRQQLALFNLVPRFIRASTWFWLRDPVSATDFAGVYTYGDASLGGASSGRGVRPVFPVG